ncbi:MAG: NUDIX domain-containing protein [Alphaproteobacteria bacterium]|nr:NUDIX domain-containing protein [Alphaproteobacteria bacterium]
MRDKDISAKDITDRVKLRELKTLSDDHYVLRRADFDFRRSDGAWQHQKRESYDLGDAMAVLPWDRARDRVLLIRQFRWPVFEWGHRQLLVEAIAGKLDGDTPDDCARREAMEEGGVTLGALHLVSHCFASPGAVKERMHAFLADYDSNAPRAGGGGHADEGEDIEVFEVTLEQALAMVACGEIIDLKTIMLLQAAKLRTI